MASMTFEPFVESDQVCRCDLCGWEGTATMPIEDPSARLDAGSEVPAGECPECGALAYVVKDEEPLQAEAKNVAAAIKSGKPDELVEALCALERAVARIRAEHLPAAKVERTLPLLEVEIEVKGGIASVAGEVPNGVRVTVRDRDMEPDDEERALGYGDGVTVFEGKPLPIDPCRNVCEFIDRVYGPIIDAGEDYPGSQAVDDMGTLVAGARQALQGVS